MATNPKDSMAATGTGARKTPARKTPARKKAPAKPGVTKSASAKPAKAPQPEAVTEPVAAKPEAAAPAPAPRKATTPRATTRRAPTRTSKPSSGFATTGAMLGVAAAGIVAGLAANLGRKAVVQAPSVMAGDWLEALKAEHKAALALLDQLAKTGPKQPAKRSMLLMQLKHALGKHAFTEENVIYPALREWGDKADADHLAHDQGYQKQFLYELEEMDKASPEFLAKVADFRIDLEAHIREEEDKIFPQMHAALPEEKNKALTAMANKEGFKLA